MSVHRINNVIDYIEVLKELRLSSNPMIYRGQANSKWDITSSAFRQMHDQMNTYVTPSQLREYHSRLIDGVRRLHDDSISNEDDITILSQLQHNKAKTILIDYTYNPLAALWFACYDKENDGSDGCVYAIETSFTQNIYPLKSKDLESLFKSTDITYIYHPNQINQRIINQQSVFLIRWLGRIDKSSHIQIFVPKDKKKSIIQELQILGITRKTLFQDFIGYIDTFEFDMDNKSQCGNCVIRAREIIESDKPNYSDAKSLLNRALKLAGSYKGTEDMAYILHELGYVSYRINAFDEAISYYDKALKVKKKYLMDDSIEMAQTMVAKGLSFIKMGQYVHALPLFEKALVSAPFIEENNNPSFRTDVLINIANIYREMGVYDKAKESAEEAEMIAFKYFGSESKKAAYIINCVGSVYARIGKEKEAKDKYETALRVFRQSSTSEYNLDTIYTYLKLASLYKLNTLGKGMTKEPTYLRKAFELLKRMPDDNIAVKRSLSHAFTIRAKYLYLSGDYQKSIECCKEAFLLSRDFGINHPKMIETDIVYADALYSTKRIDEASKYYQKAYKELFSINPGHPDIVGCMERIASCKKIR